MTVISKRLFKQLFFMNLIYAYPSNVANMRKKWGYKQDPEKMYSSLLVKTGIFTSLFIALVYYFIFFMVDFSKASVLLDASLGFFLFGNILQTFTYFFNVFYESDDLEVYMAYPLNEKTVFLSKLAVVAFANIQLAIPIMSLFSVFYIKNDFGILGGIILGIVDFIGFSALIVAVDLIIMQIMAKTAVLARIKNVAIGIVGVIIVIINVGFVIMLQYYSRNIQTDSAPGSTMKGYLSSVFLNHLSHISFIGGITLLSILLIVIVTNDIENRFYANIRRTKSGKKVKRKRNKTKSHRGVGKNITGNLLKYNFSLVKDSTVMMQAIVSPLIMPVAILIPNILFNRDTIEQYYESMGLLTGMFLGTAIGLFENSSPINLNSIMVSLDREAFEYFKALPLDRGCYLKSKLIASTIIVGSCISISTVVMGIIMQISPINIFISILSANLVTLAISPLWIKYDYKHVMTNWHNISEVQSRLPKAYIFLMVFLIMIAIVIFIGIFVFLTTLINSFYLFWLLLALEVALAVIMPRELMFFARNHK